MVKRKKSRSLESGLEYVGEKLGVIPSKPAVVSSPSPRYNTKTQKVMASKASTGGRGGKSRRSASHTGSTTRQRTNKRGPAKRK